jgi:hypothetical protein
MQAVISLTAPAHDTMMTCLDGSDSQTDRRDSANLPNRLPSSLGDSR